MTITTLEKPEALVAEVGGARGWRRHLSSLAFLAPAAVWLLVIVVYPAIATIRYSLYNETASKYIGLRNYRSVFSTASILTTFRNNVIWVLVFPFFVTVIGLILGVLAERIRWATAFKTIIIMPIVFSTTASALVWRTIFDLNPHIGVVNAAIETIDDWLNAPGSYPISASAGQSVASLASTGVRPGLGGTLISTTTVQAGGRVLMGLTGISPVTLQMLGAQKAVVPPSAAGAVTGLVWRDFSPSHPGIAGRVYPDELGLPNMRLSLVKATGGQVGTATTSADGTFTFSHVGAGSYRVRIEASNFHAGFTGVFWLGTKSLTPTGGLSQTAQSVLSVPLIDLAMIMAYLWIWAGFAMVIIGAGLAALNREVLEAARIDGANEWQTFRRVTMPMLAPVLAVVFVTMIINVLKVFDIILNMAPGSSQGEANTLALAIYNDGFTGGIHSGLASAIAVILFVLVVPAMLWNLKKIKG
jgi:alpha-glucoside transport system permease protein